MCRLVVGRRAVAAEVFHLGALSLSCPSAGVLSRLSACRPIFFLRKHSRLMSSGSTRGEPAREEGKGVSRDKADLGQTLVRACVRNAMPTHALEWRRPLLTGASNIQCSAWFDEAHVHRMFMSLTLALTPQQTSLIRCEATQRARCMFSSFIALSQAAAVMMQVVRRRASCGRLAALVLMRRLPCCRLARLLQLWALSVVLHLPQLCKDCVVIRNGFVIARIGSRREC